MRSTVGTRLVCGPTTALVAALAATSGSTIVRAETTADPTRSADPSTATDTPPVPRDARAPVAAKPSDGPRATWHPHYAVEIEAHGTVAGLDDYGPGVGFGGRVTVPLWSHAPFTRIDDDLSAGIGLDFVHFTGFQPDARDPRSTTVRVEAYYVPVFVEWSIWLGGRANLYFQPTLLYRFGGYVDRCDKPPAQCTPITKVMPTGSVGFRFRLADHVALNIRVGYPMVNLGVSWL